MAGIIRSGLVAAAILGGITSVATAAPLLTVSFKTTPVGALYAPANVVAVWIEGPTPGTFVKTIGRWAGIRKVHLVAWTNMAGINDVDAVTGATRLDHGPALTVTWDLKNKLGELVPDGIYTVRMETADGNSTATGQNNQGTFTFTKGLAPDVQSNLTDGGHTEVTIAFNPTANECNNGVVDPGETCDPPGSCPTTCSQEETTVCAPNALVGAADACTSSCVITAITSCLNDDGCCAEGCTPIQDNDCFNDEDIVAGGCATNDSTPTGGLIAFATFGAIALFTRRRRR